MFFATFTAIFKQSEALCIAARPPIIFQIHFNLTNKFLKKMQCLELYPIYFQPKMSISASKTVASIWNNTKMGQLAKLCSMISKS